VIVYARGTYSSNKEAGVSTDIARFDAYIRQGTGLAADDASKGAAESFQRAVDLYRGDLAAGTNIHAVIERERLRASYLRVLAWLAAWKYRTGDDAAALDYALRLLSTEPCREDAHRMVMRIYVRRGERAQALRQYRVCEQVLRSEFDVKPEAQTSEMYEQIRAGTTKL
jgi:DNA-binding SARP family transcriptional activator